jgi:transposase-like protein
MWRPVPRWTSRTRKATSSETRTPVWIISASSARSRRPSHVPPVEVLTDKAAVYPQVLDELAPGAWHHTEQYSNNRIEADHGRLKSRLRPMRGLKRLR